MCGTPCTMPMMSTREPFITHCINHETEVRWSSVNQYTLFWLLDIDECLQIPSTCGPKSVCINTEGSYNCSCQTGFQVADESVLVGNLNNCTGNVIKNIQIYCLVDIWLVGKNTDCEKELIVQQQCSL